MYKEIAEDLIEIFNNKAYLSIVVDSRMKKINDNDKKLYTKIIYGVCEKKLYLDYLVSDLVKGKRLKPTLRNFVRIGIYMFEYLNMEKYYIVNSLVEEIKKVDFYSTNMLNGILRNYLRTPKKSLPKDIIQALSLKLSLPIELTKLLYNQYGKEIEDFYLDSVSYNTYRINTIKVDLKTIYDYLDKEEIEYQRIDDGFITKTNLIHNELFSNGLISMQDASSMKVAQMVDLKDNLDVLDACSAPGGKSLHLAALMNNKGHILCGDIYPNKLNKIIENTNRLGVTNIEILLADASTYDYHKQFDVVLCDAPCSGLGTINHKPDLKYHLTLDDIDDIKELQMNIINHLSSFVKKGGELIYSTCTINKDENENQINKFINCHPEFIKLDELLIKPNKIQDGFYICKLKRKD